jgi:hypothetical protein
MDPERYDLKVNGRSFDVLIEEAYRTMTRFIVGPAVRSNGPGGRGCVLIIFDTKPTIKTVTLQWFEYNPACAKDVPDLERGPGSKAMLLGALMMFRDMVGTRFPHLQTLSLEDLSRFVCERKDTDIPTCVTSLVNYKKTYYQRLLNVVPSNDMHKERLTNVLEELDAAVPDFETFWSLITGKTLGSQKYQVEDLRWLNDNKAAIRSAFEGLQDRAGSMRRTLSWRHVLKKMFIDHNCKFFECCFQQLSDILGIRALEGVDWVTHLDDIPNSVNGRMVNWSYEKSASAGGGRRARAPFARIVKAAAKMKKSSHRYLPR